MTVYGDLPDEVKRDENPGAIGEFVAGLMPVALDFGDQNAVPLGRWVDQAKAAAAEACCASIQDGYGHHPGCHNAPPAVPQTVDNLLAELEATSELAPTSQDDLLTFLDELLDNALHADTCYVNPDDTVCFCLIGEVRAVLPQCEATKDRLGGVHMDATTGYIPAWRCTRTAHPASPDRHVFGEV